MCTCTSSIITMQKANQTRKWAIWEYRMCRITYKYISDRDNLLIVKRQVIHLTLMIGLLSIELFLTLYNTRAPVASICSIATLLSKHVSCLFINLYFRTDLGLIRDNSFATFNLTNALRSGQWFFWPNLMATDHILVHWPLINHPDFCMTFFTPAVHYALVGILPTKFSCTYFQNKLTRGWPWMTLPDLWHQQCPGQVFFRQRGGHRTFLSKLTSGCPPMTPAWPLTQALDCTPVRSFSNQNWQPYAISKAVWPPDDMYGITSKRHFVTTVFFPF